MAKSIIMQILPLLLVCSIIAVAIIICPCSANPTTTSFFTINPEEDTTTELIQNIDTTIRTETVYDSTGEIESTGRSIEIESRDLHYSSPSETETSTPQQVVVPSSSTTVENATESQLGEHDNNDDHHNDGEEDHHNMSSLKPTGPLSLRQEEVIKELNNIWNYSASLNDTDKELKTTLSSVVELAYARLKTEPDETLHRLNYLLKKLRQRIGFPSSESDDDDNVELEHKVEANRDNSNEDQSTLPSQTQHILNSTSNNDSIIESTTLQHDNIETKTTEKKKNSSVVSSDTTEIKNRKKRATGLGTGIGEYESVPTSTFNDDDENSLYSNFFHYNPYNNHESMNSFEYNHHSNQDDDQQVIIPTATPGEKTIQKIILVQDMMTRSPLTVVSNQKPIKNSSPPNFQSTESSSSSTIFLPPLKILPQPNTNHNNNVNLHKNHHPLTQNQTPQQDREPVSVEQIALAIVKLLYPTLHNYNNNNNNPNIATENYSTAHPPSSEFTFPVHKDMFLNKLSLLNNPDHNQLQQQQVNLNKFHLTTTKPNLYPTYLQVHPLPLLLAVSNNNNNSTITPNTVQSYPPILQQLIASQMQVSHPQTSPSVSVDVDLTATTITTPIPNSSLNDTENETMINKLTVVQDDIMSDNDTHSDNLVENDQLSSETLGTKSSSPLLEDGGETTSKSVETTEMMTTTAAASFTTSTPPPVQVVQIIEELSDSNLMAGPTAFINGTREGLVQFIATLSTLSFTTKMVMVFALSISALSIILGVYSLGPPIIAVGILGILIPIAILLLLQDSNKSKSQNTQGKIMEELKDEMFIVLNLIENAFQKYGQATYSDQ